MVRTKADGALRVAVGGKAPKKNTNSNHRSSSISPTENVGKDNFPVNKYFPRETPAWQKKITGFTITKTNKSDKGGEGTSGTSTAQIPYETNENEAKRSKRSKSALDKSDEIDMEDEVEASAKRFKSSKMKNMPQENEKNRNNAMETDG